MREDLQEVINIWAVSPGPWGFSKDISARRHDITSVLTMCTADAVRDGLLPPQLLRTLSSQWGLLPSLHPSIFTLLYPPSDRKDFPTAQSFPDHFCTIPIMTLNMLIGHSFFIAK